MSRPAFLSVALIVAACGSHSDERNSAPVEEVTYRDPLTNPIRIVTAKGDTLVLADGSSRNVPGIQDLVAICPSLDAVEVHPDGALFGLVRVHRTCGNDPVPVRDEKVPIVPMIAILREKGPKLSFWDGMIDVNYIYDLVRVCGGTWDDHTGATFPGE